MRTEGAEDETTAFNRRNNKLIALVRTLPFDERTHEKLTARRIATERAQHTQRRHSSTPLDEDHAVLQQLDMSITAVQGESAGAAALTTSADQNWIVTAQNEEEPRRTSQQHIREAINLGKAIAGGSFPPPITTQNTWINTLSTTTVTASTTMATMADTYTTHSTPQSVFTTRTAASANDPVQCTLTNGITYTMPRAVACEMARIQRIAREYDQEIRQLQEQMSELIASTRLYALSNRTTRNEASTQKQKTLNFQDTYRLEYIDEESSHAGSRRTGTNANARHPQALNPTAQNFTPQRDDVKSRGPQEQPQPHARIRQESWGGGFRATRKADTRAKVPLSINP